MNALEPFDPQPGVLDRVLRLGVKKSYPRGRLFLDGHTSSNLLLFVQKGAMRNFFCLEGLELTYWISIEGDFSCTVNFFTRTPGETFLEALEPLEVIEVKRDQLLLAYQHDPTLEHFGRLLAEHQLGILERNYLIISEKSAWERYQLFLKWYPQLNGRVPLKYVASLLRLDQGTLSRVRGKNGSHQNKMTF